MTLILGIESTCDETGCAVVKNGSEILSNVVASQVELHKVYGGVVPELACRQHVDMIIPVIDQAIKDAGVTLDDIDIISVAKGPGLIGALLIGLNAAKALSFAINKPFIGINHVEAHLYAAMMGHLDTITFPSLGVVISGGHTFLLHISDVGKYQAIGTTVDDAIGEAFDKVAKILGLPYPGGPAIESLAKSGDPHHYPFKSGTIKGRPLNFSFSGLKTSVLYTIKGQGASKHSPLIINDDEKRHVAASFQNTAFTDIVKKVSLALEQHDFQSVFFGGGVSNNSAIRDMVEQENIGIPVFWPPRELTQDNAAMIAGLAYHYRSNLPEGDPLDLEPMTRIPSFHCP